ncbi:hypothetical protein D1007_58658 [Hordeum vulgare]|nr:hypothetical protein D1007_58658 [Hordeum vulgare]
MGGGVVAIETAKLFLASDLGCGGGGSGLGDGGGGNVADRVGSFSEVNNWLGRSSYAMEPASQVALQQSEAEHASRDDMDCSLSDGKWHLWFHFNGRNRVKRGIYDRYIYFVTLVSLIASEGYGESYFIYYVKEGEIGIEGVKYLSTKGSVKEMLELYHHRKVLNIKVVKVGEPDSRTQSFDNYMNTRQSCNIINDRKAQLERSRIQREQHFNHFEGNSEVPEFCSDDSVHSHGGDEVVVIQLDSAVDTIVSEDEREFVPFVDTLPVKHVNNPGPTYRSHQESEKKQIPHWFPEADEFCFHGDYGIGNEEEAEDEVELPFLKKKAKMKKKRMKDRCLSVQRCFKGFSCKDFEIFSVPQELPHKNYYLVFTKTSWM